MQEPCSRVFDMTPSNEKLVKDLPDFCRDSPSRRKVMEFCVQGHYRPPRLSKSKAGGQVLFARPRPKWVAYQPASLCFFFFIETQTRAVQEKLLPLGSRSPTPLQVDLRAPGTLPPGTGDRLPLQVRIPRRCTCSREEDPRGRVGSALLDEHERREKPRDLQTRLSHEIPSQSPKPFFPCLFPTSLLPRKVRFVASAGVVGTLLSEDSLSSLPLRGRFCSPLVS